MTLSRFSRSLLGEFGETVRVERYAGDAMEGGYSDRTYHDPIDVEVVVRPGDIDVPFTDTLGDHGTVDLWCIAPGDVTLGQKDRLTRRRGFGSGTFGDGHFGTGSTFEVSMARHDGVHDIAVYQLDEADTRG